MENNEPFIFDREFIIDLGFDPQAIIDVLESKKALEITASQIRAVKLLKQNQKNQNGQVLSST